MRQTIQPNRTLLVDGPASVCLVSGKTEVFGYPIKEAQLVVVRTGKRMAFHAIETSEVEVMLGANATMKEFEGNTIPESWNHPIQVLRETEKKPTIIMVIGTSDSGKSSFCTYLFNKLIENKGRVAVLDGDFGQSDIGPSASVGYGIASKQITELYRLKLQNGYFLGVISPVSATSKIIEGLKSILTEICQRQADYILINTDGWISNEDAVDYKIALIEVLKPDLVVGIQVQNELEPLRAKLTQPIMLVKSSDALNMRTPEKRKVLREMTYTRYLKNAKIQCYPLSQIKVEPRNAVPKKQEPEKVF